MSLINDALKRATQTPSSSPTAPAPETHAAMQPVDYHRRGLPWFFFPTLLLVLSGACWFIVKGIQASRLPGDAMAVHARESKPDPAPSIRDEPAAEMLAAGFAPTAPDTAYTPTQLPNRNFSLEDPPATPTAHDTTPTVAAAADPPKPAFKLQGIFFRTTNPSATVNGKNVMVGSRVSGATVKAITRDGVTLEADGQTTVLTLE
jgi:hypothetical protein